MPVTSDTRDIQLPRPKTRTSTQRKSATRPGRGRLAARRRWAGWHAARWGDRRSPAVAGADGEGEVMSRGLRVLERGFLGLWPFGNAQPLMIDMRRVNVELRREALRELEEDVAYRNRVKQRMREGSGCTPPPLIDRKKVLPFAARPGVSTESGTTASPSLAAAG